MVANTGTYVGSPFHRYADGKDLSELPLASLADLDCLVARKADVRGKLVRAHTDWARHWRSQSYFEGSPYLTGRLAQWLRDAAAALVGIDPHNIDSTALANDRCTRRCWARTFRSWSISAGSKPCRNGARDSSPSR
jgi:kynurenine formamidase